MTPFEDLKVFREAIALMVEIYRLTDSFPRHELYGLTSQVRRSAGSVVAHIAEEQGRLTYGERRQLLSQGRGSLFETQAHLIAAKELGYVEEARFAEIRQRAKSVECLLAGMIRYVRRGEAQSRGSKRFKRPVPIPRTPNPD
jgi:four helix bundle protein